MRNSDARDKKSARLAGIAMLVLVLVVLAVLLLLMPELESAVATHFTPGVDLRGAALAGFIVTVLLFVLFAVVAGDGLIGELQFMIAGFFSFFVMLTLMIAWIF